MRNARKKGVCVPVSSNKANATHTSAASQVQVWDATSATNMKSATHVPNEQSTSTLSPSFPDPFDSQSPVMLDFVTQEYLDIQYESTNILVSLNIRVVDD